MIHRQMDPSNDNAAASLKLDYDPRAVGDRDMPAPGARKALTLLLAINLFNYVDRYVLAAVEPKVQEQFFRSSDPNAEFLMGSLATAFMVSYMLAAPVFGWLADRMSRWLLVGVSVLLWSLATGASGLAGTFTILLITRLFVGVGEAGYGPAAPTIIADLYPLARRGAVLSWFYAAIPVGSALGYAMGGLVADHYDWRHAFYVVVPPGLLLAVLCFFMRDPRRGQVDAGASAIGRAATSKPARKASTGDYLMLLKTPSYVLDCLGMAAMTFAIGGIAYWMPKYLLTRPHTGNLGQINVIFGAITVFAGFTATLAGGWVGDKLKARFPSSYFLVSGIAMLIACPLILLMLWMPFPLAWGVMFLAVFFLFFNTGPSNTILANVTHPSIRATAFAINILVIHALGDATAPPILGKIGHYSWNAAFMLVAAVMALAGLFWLWGCRYLAADTAAAPHRLGEGP
jgi:MFS family permease